MESTLGQGRCFLCTGLTVLLNPTSLFASASVSALSKSILPSRWRLWQKQVCGNEIYADTQCQDCSVRGSSCGSGRVGGPLAWPQSDAGSRGGISPVVVGGSRTSRRLRVHD